MCTSLGARATCLDILRALDKLLQPKPLTSPGSDAELCDLFAKKLRMPTDAVVSLTR